MVRAPAHALPRPTGFALLKPAEKPQLDSARIITMSGTIAVNLLAFGLLMLPLSMPPPAIPVDEEPTMTIFDVFKQPEVVEVPIDRPKPKTPAPTIQPRTVAPTHSEVISTPVTIDTGNELAPDTTSEDTGPIESIAVIDATPAPMHLEYRVAPAPIYPRRALQQRLTGTVLLQVLVGIDGRPLEVKVAQSSGHRELDEAARAQVLKRWSFQPATKDGLAVQAIGMVPIEFALKQ